MVFFLVDDEAQAVSFCNRTVCRSSFARCLCGYSALRSGYPFYILPSPLFYPPPHLFPHVPFRKPGYFLCKVRLPAVCPVKYRLRLPPENLPPRNVGERIFRVLLARACHQSFGQKNNQPSVQKCIGGKTKNQS